MKQVTPDTQIAVTIRLPKALHDRLHAESERRSTDLRKVSMVEIVREAIDSVC